MRIHTGERSFECEMCDAAFGNNNVLKRHVIICTGDRPFKCEMCVAEFSSHSGNLKLHLRTHTGERPFNYYMCDAEFCGRDLKNQHDNSHW